MACFTHSLSHCDRKRPSCGEVDWLDDAELSADQRAQCSAVATPRIGHMRRRCWLQGEERS